MKLKVGEVMVDYKEWGKGKEKETVVVMHGWVKGMEKERYLPLIDLLKEKYQVIAFDFPGFGKSSSLPRPWSLDDYVNLTANFLKRVVRGEGTTLLGHSFGGRVAIKLAARNETLVKKIILVDSAGVERKSLKVKFLGMVAGIVPIWIKRRVGWFGSRDYQDTEDNWLMRETMKNVVGENLETVMNKVNLPTLIIWGSNDRTTPLWQAKIINKSIKGSVLKVVEGGNHSLPYKFPGEVNNLVVEWLA